MGVIRIVVVMVTPPDFKVLVPTVTVTQMPSCLPCGHCACGIFQFRFGLETLLQRRNMATVHKTFVVVGHKRLRTLCTIACAETSHRLPGQAAAEADRASLPGGQGLLLAHMVVLPVTHADLAESRRSGPAAGRLPQVGYLVDFVHLGPS